MNTPSLSELLAAYKTTGPADAVNSLTQGAVAGVGMANEHEKRKQDFQNKLKELGIMQQKADADTADAKARQQQADVSQAGLLHGEDFTKDEKGKLRFQPRPGQAYSHDAIKAVLGGGGSPARAQLVGPALDLSGKPLPGKAQVFVPDTDGGPGHLELVGMPDGVGGVGPKNTPNIPASMVTEEGQVANQQIQLDALEKMLKTLPDGPVGGLRSVLGNVTMGNIAGPEHQYNDLQKSVATSVYRAMTGDTRLSDADAAQRAYPLMPHLSEPQDVRMNKLNNLRQIMSQRQDVIAQQQQRARNPAAEITRGTSQPAPSTPAPTQAQMPSFDTEEQAHAANLPKGSIVMIGGRKARID